MFMTRQITQREIEPRAMWLKRYFPNIEDMNCHNSNPDESEVDFDDELSLESECRRCRSVGRLRTVSRVPVRHCGGPHARQSGEAELCH